MKKNRRSSCVLVNFLSNCFNRKDNIEEYYTFIFDWDTFDQKLQDENFSNSE